MVQPNIKKFPTEIFGLPYNHSFEEIRTLIENQYCHFRNGECNKPRKSEPHIKVGICSVGYKGVHQDTYKPVIICPDRLEDSNVFNKIENDFFGNIDNNIQIRWVREVSLGVSGHVDYVAVKLQRFGDLESIQDFVCVELQAAGTTGTPYQAVKEMKEHGRYLKQSYNYGINWANEFVKTMGQQILKKGLLIDSWGKKLVFIIQDVGMDYLKGSCDASGLHQANGEDPIFIYTFQMKWNEIDCIWRLEFKEKYSGNSEGILKLISGAHSDDYLSMEVFKDNIRRKLESEI